MQANALWCRMGASDGFELGRVDLRIEDKHRISATAAAQSGSDSINKGRARAACAVIFLGQAKNLFIAHRRGRNQKLNQRTVWNQPGNDRDTESGLTQQTTGAPAAACFCDDM